MSYYTKAIVAVVLLWVPPSVHSAAVAACLNNQDFVFFYEGKARPCSNIRLKEDRRRTLCQEDSVRDNCPQTCGICCDDDPDFEFSLKKRPNTKQDCNWIVKNENRVDTRRENYCAIDDYDPVSGSTIRNMCPKACDFCQDFVAQGPTEAPTTAAPTTPAPTTPAPTTAAPTTAAPTTPAPTTAAPTTAAPTEAPTTAAPTTAAPTALCEDSTAFEFELINFPGEMRGCEWISINENRKAARQATYCGEVADSCPKACEICACEDDDDFLFELLNFPGVERGCAWIIANDLKKEARQENYCDAVGESCPAACELCS